MSRAALYLRVSTDQQTTENQRPALEQLARARGHELAAVFEEVESGAKTRPVLEGACDAARRGEFQVLIVWALDRLGRSMLETIDRVLNLRNAGVAVLSFREPWLETSGPASNLLLAVFAWAAEFERERLRERTMAGLERARKGGRVGGRPKASPLAVHLAALKHSEGMPAHQAAREAKISLSTLRRHLKNNPPAGNARAQARQIVAKEIEHLTKLEGLPEGSVKNLPPKPG